MAAPKQVTGWVGWVYFAGFMMIIVGLLHAISGFAALLNDKYYLVKQNDLLVFDFTTWGWIHLVLGVLVLLAGTSLINGNYYGRFVGVALAVVGVVVNFAFLSAYPLWSLLLIAVNVLVIYALTVHGAEAQE